ncbi:MAG: HAD-IB family hydrolase [Bacteroidota bacterium]
MKETLPSNGCDFFDVDHTIVDGSTSLQSLITGIELQMLPLRILYSIPKIYLQYYFGSLDTSVASRCIKELEGMPKSDLQQIGEQNFRKRIRPKIFKDAELCIAERISSGRKIVLITSSFTHVVEPLAMSLHVEHILANTLVIDRDLTSGYIQEPFLFGIEKKVQALAFMDSHGFLPQECSFFTDSVNDLPLLDIVGEPVVVNPDYRLRKIARERNWKIEKFHRHKCPTV